LGLILRIERFARQLRFAASGGGLLIREAAIDDALKRDSVFAFGEAFLMFSRPMLFLGVLVAAVVVPYVLLDEHLSESVHSTWDRLLGRMEEEKDDALNALHAANYSPASGTTSQSAPTPIEQIFRFDLTPQWVASRWPRVSTVAGSDPDQLGMRVVLVTGTRPDDIAGSLTYYFDRHHQMRRITFTGLTRDPRRLLASVVTPYRLKSQPTTDAAHYIGGDAKSPTSEVIVRHMPVLVAEAGIANAEVEVDLSSGESFKGNGGDEEEGAGKILSSLFRRW
jgi:hypothetical protein